MLSTPDIDLERLRIAIAHDWVDSRSGSEKVFEAIARLFPRADLYTLTRERHVELDVAGRSVWTSPLDRSSFLRNRRSVTLPLMPLAWRHSARGQAYDVVITSSHAAVKGFYPGRHSLHLCYCHTPMRYIWEPQLDLRANGGMAKGFVREAMKRWDRMASHWVDSFAANSSTVAARISAAYGRQARVIYPPVDVEFFSLANGARPRGHALALSRWVPYKNVHLAVEACIQARTPLIVAGSGPEEPRLRRLASGNESLVTFVHQPSDLVVRELLESASMLVFPAHEDFGIVPVEAQAAGTPVLGLNRGGTAETVVHATSGWLVDDLSVEAFARGIRELSACAIKPADCRANAKRFSRERFDNAVLDWVRQEIEHHSSDGRRPTGDAVAESS